jgi:hypothetical protein
LLEHSEAIGFSVLPLSFLHTPSNADELIIDALETDSDSVGDGLLDLVLDETHLESLYGLAKQIVFEVPDGKHERVNLGVYILDGID